MADEDEAAKLRWAGGAQHPVWYVNKPNKMGARSARARTRDQNPLVVFIRFFGKCEFSRIVIAQQ